MRPVSKGGRRVWRRPRIGKQAQAVKKRGLYQAPPRNCFVRGAHKRRAVDCPQFFHSASGGVTRRVGVSGQHGGFQTRRWRFEAFTLCQKFVVFDNRIAVRIRCGIAGVAPVRSHKPVRAVRFRLPQPFSEQEGVKKSGLSQARAKALAGSQALTEARLTVPAFFRTFKMPESFNR